MWAHLSAAEAEKVSVIHARISECDPDTLCDRDGGERVEGRVALCLDHEKALEYVHRVNCHACLAWMHA
jgi:hypothetical protein